MVRSKICFVVVAFFLMQFKMVSQSNFYKSWVYLNKANETVKFQLLEKTTTISPNENLYYYWYKQNDVHRTQGAYEGKLLNGEYITFYLSNALKEKGCYKKGLKNGKWIKWYENGTIMEVTHWKKGALNGCATQYNEKGQLVLRAIYKNNLLHGQAIAYEDGKIISEKKYSKGLELEQKTASTENVPILKKIKTKWSTVFHNKKKDKKSE